MRLFLDGVLHLPHTPPARKRYLLSNFISLRISLILKKKKNLLFFPEIGLGRVCQDAKKSVMIQRSKKSQKKFVIRKTWNCWRYEEQCVVGLEPHFCLNMFFFSFAQTNQKQDEFIRPVKVCKLSIIDSLRVKDFGEHQRTNRRSLLNGHFVSLLF